ncbi:hypothetical protein GCM10027040_16520 [Halomonas shantousis]
MSYRATPVSSQEVSIPSTRMFSGPRLAKLPIVRLSGGGGQGEGIADCKAGLRRLEYRTLQDWVVRLGI